MLRALLLATCVTGCSGAMWLGGTIQSVTNNKLGGSEKDACPKDVALFGAIIEAAIAGAVIYHDDKTADAVVLPIIGIDGILGVLALKEFCK